jgi:hypothetical protein
MQRYMNVLCGPQKFIIRKVEVNIYWILLPGYLYAEIATIGLKITRKIAMN